MLVKDVMGLPRRRLAKDDIGLEIEVEGRRLPIPNKYWRCDRDGSLRGEESMEYVLDRPSSLQTVEEALQNLQCCYKDNQTRIDETVRAGVHVHINCQKLTLTELYKFFVLYLVLENILIKYCGEYREGNLFCLRCQDAEFLLYALIRAAKDRNFLGHFHDDNVRYASMNVKALGDYGSLEFRAMRSTKDLDAILDWVKILLNLREVSKEFDSPVQIIEQVSGMGRKAFLEKCLGPFANFFNGVVGVDDLLAEGVQLAQCLAYCVNWKTWDNPIFIGGVEFPNDGRFHEEPLGDY